MEFLKKMEDIKNRAEVFDKLNKKFKEMEVLNQMVNKVSLLQKEAKEKGTDGYEELSNLIKELKKEAEKIKQNAKVE